MRIIAGALRSRRIEAPAGLATRPTSDRLRETLFNVLAPRIADAVFLDLYAGSGAVGIEALSRGARQVVFVERAQPALKVLRANLQALQLTAGFRVQAESASAFLRGPRSGGAAFDVIFLDPPYDAAGEYETVLGWLGAAAEDRIAHVQEQRAGSGWLAEGAVVIAEHRRKEALHDAYGALQRTRLLEQGDAALSFFAVADRGRSSTSET
jgi:16S rRNA (guanine966-N2)-methyltransferase